MANAKVIKKPEPLQINERTKHLMEEMPVWKAILKMAIPSVILMLIAGGYMFADNVLAIQFAPDSYGGSKDIVRMGMSAFSPINALVMAFSLLFGLGISTRVSINLGAKRMGRAKNTIKTGTMIGMGIAVLLIPILMFASKPWMASQFQSASAGTLSDMGFDYGWIIIMLIPFSFFNQILSGLFRTEGRMKAMMLPMIASIGVNLLFDWILMGPAGYGIEGGAWATFISTIMVTVIYLILIIRKKDSIIRLKNLFGFKFKALSVIGIILVGISPFLRNFAQSITQTVEMSVIKDVSGHIYSQKGQIGFSLTEIGKTIDINQIKGMFGDSGFQAALKTNNSDIIYKAVDTYANAHVPIADKNAFILFNKNLIMASAFDPTIFSIMLDPKTHEIMLDPTTHKIIFNGFLFAKTAPTGTALAAKIIPVVTANQMTLILTGVLPIFALFFPTLFAFAQAGRPIASYNFGAKKMDRVRKTFWWTVLFSTIAAIIMYFIAAFALNYPLMEVLGVSNVKESFGAHESTAYRATLILRIMMIAMPMFGFAIGAMILTGSTDRVVQSIIISSLRGIIYFFPAIFIFKIIAIDHPTSEFLFWWFYPALAGASVITSLLIAMHVLKNLDKKVKTLDDKLTAIYSKIENRKWLRRKSK